MDDLTFAVRTIYNLLHVISLLSPPEMAENEAVISRTEEIYAQLARKFPDIADPTRGSNNNG
jgi:hypothetical protein